MLRKPDGKRKTSAQVHLIFARFPGAHTFSLFDLVAPIVEYAKGTFSAERPDFGARTESESEGDALNRSRRFNCEVTVALIFVVIYGCVLDFICIVSLNSC